MSTGDMYDPEARRMSPTLQRQWSRYMAEIDRDLAGDDEDEPAPKRIVETPAPTPENAKTMHRYSHEEQDAYSDRMRARFGGEW